MDKKLVTVYIDDTAYQVDGANNLLAGVLSKKLDLPYFCWHPSLGSVGACRQCAVTQYQDENDTKGRLVMACTTPVTDGMRIGLNNENSSTFREEVIGAMMTNHPHDCPVCAEGGECHLQDMTVMTGHTSRDYSGLKRTFTNQNLGEFVGHEMNRCITCYRCVRFYKDYAGGEDFGVYGSKNQVYFGRYEAGQLESEFSGNLVEVCPTGVFTNKLFSAHFSRKWDLQSSPSVCANCSVGCNTSIGERYGSVRRITNRYHYDINSYFLCDHGRFGIGYVNSERRILNVKGIDLATPNQVSNLDINKAILPLRKKRIIGIGSARASLESNQLLKLMVGEENFSIGMSDAQLNLANIHRQYCTSHQSASVRQIENSDFILIIGEDITQSAGRLSLAVRQALRNKGIEAAKSLGVPSWQDSAVRTISGTKKSPMYIFSNQPTKLDSVAKNNVTQSTIDTIQDVKLLNSVLSGQTYLHDISEDLQLLLADLKAANAPLIIGGWDHSNASLLSQTVDLIESSKTINENTLSVIVPPQVNTLGQLYLHSSSTLSTEQAITMVIADDDIAGLLVLENELSCIPAELLTKLKLSGKLSVVIDHNNGAWEQSANIILPSAPVSEAHGHFVNYEGRVQPYVPALASELPVQESWQWLLMIAQGLNLIDGDFQQITNYNQLQKWFAENNELWPIHQRNEAKEIPREPHRVSGRTAKMANQTVHETKTTQSSDDYRFSMEGNSRQGNGNMPYVWAPKWNSNQAITQFQVYPDGPLEDTADDVFIKYKGIELNTNKIVSPENTDRRFPCVGIVTPWYRRDWLTHIIPEFRVLSTEHCLALSSQYAEQQGVEQGQWLTLTLKSHHNDQRVITTCQVSIDKNLPESHAYLNADLIRHNHWSIEQLMPATDQDVAQFISLNKQQVDTAKREQQSSLMRLKERDQMIPIRLVAGGLNDD